jgi:hypothetical protein
MDSNTHSIQPMEPTELPEPLERLERSEPLGPPGWPEWPERSASPERLDWLEPSRSPEPLGPPEGLEDVAELTAVLDKLAARDVDRLPVLVRAQRALALQQLANRLHGQWLNELAGVDAAAPPAPTRTSRPRRQPPGFGIGCGWALVRPEAACGPRGPCSAAPSPRRRPR